MGSSYLNYRDSLKKKWFKPYGEVTEEARANVPPGLEKDDWNCLVDLWSLESENKRIEADVELKEEVKHLKSMLEQQAIQMAKQRRHLRNSK